MNKQQYALPKYKLATIYQGLIRLNHLIRKMTFCLSKTDRRIYGDRAIEYAMNCLGEFIVAFDFNEERPQHYMRLVAEFHKLQCCIDIINNENIIRKGIPVKMDIDANYGTRTKLMRADRLMLAIFNEIGKIDNDIMRWRHTAIPSSPLASQTPCNNVVANGSL